MSDGPAPELREPMIPSKGYTLAEPRHRTIGRVTDIYGLEIGLGVAGDRVSVFVNGASRTLSTAQLGHFQRLLDQAGREANPTAFCQVGLCVNESMLHPPRADCGAIGHA